MMNTTVILPAAGLGSRFAVGDSASASKIEFDLAHKPVFLRTIERFHGRMDVGQILLAVHPKAAGRLQVPLGGSARLLRRQSHRGR